MDLDKILVNDNFVSSGKSKDIYLIPDGKYKGKYAFVFTDRGTGYIDKDGKPVFDPGYDNVVGEIPGKGAIACKFATYFFRLLARHLSFSDINGPRGGDDKRCQLRIPLTRMRDVIIEDTAADLYQALDRAIDRASRTLERRLSRQREFGHALPFPVSQEIPADGPPPSRS